MVRRPLIGITMRLELGTRRFYLGRDYCEAIYAAGGLPVHIPLITDSDHIKDVVSRLDGVLLPGCDSDPDPALYGEEPHPMLGHVVPEKDATDLAVIAEAENRNLPIFAICFGMQILNVARGGTLIQDIPSQVENAINHQQGIPRERNSHHIRIESGSLISQLVSESARVRVNSHHHQAVKVVGEGLKATSWTADGVIESIEDASKNFVGVQWHPELSWQSDSLSSSLFEWFVKKCHTKVSVAA
ncbi:MAG: gamma-glutamyl-gamma-aminobutyrate hydrolase family protein [Pyrinomonadaceae bacterium]